MHNRYDDIRYRIDEDPTWWDENAVPRYGDFDHTAMVDIYAGARALLRISCQNCGHLFDVAMSWDKYNVPMQEYDVPYLAYGDPPNIGCCASGPTMNSNSIRVLQWWQRDDSHVWVRNPDFEVLLQDSILARFLAATCEDDQIDLVYEGVDSLVRQGHFQEVDALLRGIDDTMMAKMPVVCLLAWVSITHVVSHFLPCRPVFLARVRKHLEQVEPNRVEELLRGFNC